MASLKNRRGMWYARVQWYEENGRKEKQIPLKSESKVTARERLAMVNQVEHEIIEMYKSVSFTSIFAINIQVWINNWGSPSPKNWTILRNCLNAVSFASLSIINMSPLMNECIPQ